jgi:hypothetical protein
MARLVNRAPFIATPADEATTMADLHTYIVAYDSGFAPNPFNGYCTLSTCKPEIRKHAAIGDWIIGTGSNRKTIKRGGYLVHAMRVNEILSYEEYWNDIRFQKKKPNLNGSYKMACGDNIYYRFDDGDWQQLNSYHSKEDGSPNSDHINRDTRVNRVLVSSDFVYFGAEGPKIPDHLTDLGIVLSGRGRKKVSNQNAIKELEFWLEELSTKGYQGRPYDMKK